MRPPSFHALARSALAAAAMLGLAAPLPAPGAGALPRRARPFFAFDNGVGRDAGWTPDRQAAVLDDLGYDGIGYSGTGDLAERLRAFRARGLEVFSIYVGARVDGAVESVEPALGAAFARLEGTGTIVWLTLQGHAPDDRRAVEIVRAIAAQARTANLRVALYPHKGFHVATAEDALRVATLAGCANVGVSINLAHELAAGNVERLPSIVRACASRLFLVSINGADRTGGWAELIRVLGEGDYDVGALLDELDRVGYDGPVGLQCYRVPGDPKSNLSRSIAAWRALCTRRGAPPPQR